MTFSAGRAGVFFMIGLPIGFILAALGFVIAEREIAAPAMAPLALAIAVIVGVVAGLRKKAG